MRVKGNFLLTIFAVFLSIVASILSSSYSWDSVQYKRYFRLIESGVNVSVEPSFYYVSFLSSYFFSSPLFVFIFYSSVSVLIKIYLIRRYSPYPLLSLIVFCSYFFLVQESNMIRVGLASSFLILACFCYFEKKYLDTLFFL